MDRESTGAPASILRRFAALFYDLILVTALLFAATFAALPLSGGEAITPASQGAGAYLYRAWLLFVAFAYFGLSWTRGGRTLGMRAWRLRLTTESGQAPGWPAALARFGIGLLIAIPAGLGLWLAAQPGSGARVLPVAALLLPLVANFLWIPFDPGRRSVQDLACRMRLRRG